MGGDSTKKRNIMIICIILLSIPGLLIGPYAMVNAGGGQNVLVQGAAIHGCNGIYFDSEDNLYIGSVWGNSITIINPQTGTILDTLGPEDGVYSPDDVFIAPDGSIYWTSIITGSVGRIQPDGTLTTQLVSQGVNPITMNDEGRLFVALDFLGDGFYELDPNLEEEPTLLHGPMGYLNGFDFGPDGYLYGPLILKGEIVRVDVDTNPATVETLVSDLTFPAAVKFDSQGRLHFADQMTGEITRLDMDTMEMEVVAQVTQGLDNLAFDSQDRLYVSHAHDGTLYQVLPSDETRIVLQGGLIFPGGVAAMMKGNQEHIVVADLWTMRVFEGGTGDLLKVERHLETGATLSGAVTVSVDGDNLIATTWLSNNVFTFDPDTSHVIDSYIDESWRPMDAIRFMRDIVFTELVSGSIKKVDNTSIASGFYVPTGLASIGDDLYVADWASGMVWQVFDDGVLTMTPLATGLSKPEGLTGDIDGSLLVVESGAGRLSRIDTQTGKVSLVAEDLALGHAALPGFPPTWVFNGVDVGPSGNIYVTGDIADVLYSIGATERVIGTVDELPDGAFRDPDNADMYRRKIGKVLGTVQRLIDKGRYSSARAFLKFLRRRTDGTGNDWVVHTAYQQALMDLIDIQISSLTQQIEG